MLRIPIASMAQTGWKVDEQVDPLLLPLLSDVSRNGSAEFTRPVHARIHSVMAGESILIEGRVQTAVRMTCSRCLAPFEATIDIDFTATAIPANPEITDGILDDVELSANEMDVITYAGESIDLREEIAQQVIMALPYKPLCHDTCKGLCGRCGIDLNHNACQCDNQDQGSPFAVLKTLTLPPK